jgi:predicted phage terminase large subunit-like protein
VRLPIHGPEVVRNEGESTDMFLMRKRAAEGLVEKVINTCNKYNVDMLIIEAKGPGISVAQEIQRLNRTNTWSVFLSNPGNLDKVARVYAVQPTFAGGSVYAPDKDWAEKVITQVETFPKAKHDDLVDAVSQGIKYLKDRNFLRRPEEILEDIRGEVAYKPAERPVYDV